MVERNKNQFMTVVYLFRCFLQKGEWHRPLHPLKVLNLHNLHKKDTNTKVLWRFLTKKASQARVIPQNGFDSQRRQRPGSVCPDMERLSHPIRLEFPRDARRRGLSGHDCGLLLRRKPSTESPQSRPLSLIPFLQIHAKEQPCSASGSRNATTSQVSGNSSVYWW